MIIKGNRGKYSMSTKVYSTTSQLSYLLPTQKDFDMMKKQGGWHDKQGVDTFPGYVETVCIIMDDIIQMPNEPELWFKLYGMFGTHADVSWKFIFVAHRLEPENVLYLEQLAKVIHWMGDINLANSLMDKENFDPKHNFYNPFHNPYWKSGLQ